MTIKESYSLNFQVLQIEQMSSEELDNLASQHNFSLPTNDKFKDRIRNLFYLNEYLKYISNSEKLESFSEFIDLLWKNKIQNYAVKRNNIHIARNNCFLEISKIRANTGKFYVNSTDLSDEALAGLIQDEILGYSDTHNGYFITHDIYEEWGLERIINQTYHSHGVEEFFLKIGDSLPIRRAFRTWLSQQLSETNDDIKKFVREIFKDQSISQFWKDELIVSVLLSEYSQEFFDFFEEELIDDNFLIAKHILFLLRVACKEDGIIPDTTKPKGKGWHSIIDFIYKYKDDCFYKQYKAILPVLYDWVETNHQGNTTKLAGLMAIDVLNLSELENKISLSTNSENDIFEIIFLACNEIKNELEIIFDMVIENKFIEYNHPYYEFCSIIIEKSYKAGRLIQLLPKSIISLCELFWLEKNYQKSHNHHYSNGFDLEKSYGLHQHKSDYFPASANQTPIWWLLDSKDFESAISFIINFTNETVENYAISKFDKDNVIKTELIIGNKKIEQFHNSTLWLLYRGTGTLAAPNLLKSMHMALEKFLLQITKILDRKIIENLLLTILLQSKSSSLTSVVCSIVLAYPSEFKNIALILFSNRDFFHSDLLRCNLEYRAKTNCLTIYSTNEINTILYTNERLQACEEPHRKNHLKFLCLHYQFNGVKHYSEENKNFINSIYDILDKHHSSFSNSEEDIGKSILFTRMDRRKLKPSIVENEKSVEVYLTPELSPPQKEQSQNAQVQNSHIFKHTELMLWASNEQSHNSNNKYDENPSIAFKELENLIQDWQSNPSYEFLLINRSLPHMVSAKLIAKYSDALSTSQQEYCRDIILSLLEKMVLNDNGHQIGDGFEECTHAIPKLIELFPDHKDKLIAFLLLTLFKTNSLGAYKRICDYAIETIHEEDIWENNFTLASEILNGYITYKPLFSQAKLEVTNESRSYYNDNTFYEKVLNKFQVLCDNDPDDNLDLNNIDFSQLEKHDIKDLEIVLQILPNNTNHSEHLLLLKTIMPKIAVTLLNNKDRNSDIFYTRINTFEKLSEILLSRKDKNEICEILEPFLTSFKNNEYMADFLRELFLQKIN